MLGRPMKKNKTYKLDEKTKKEAISRGEKIKTLDFKCEYAEGSRWTEILISFLDALGKEFGYSLDEYDLLGIVWEARVDKLGKLLNENPESDVINRMFQETVRHSIYWKSIGEKARKDYKKGLEVLMPSDKVFYEYEKEIDCDDNSDHEPF